MWRTHLCGELREEHVGTQVRLQGWVWHRRDLGGLIFVDLRDRAGAVQCVFNPGLAAQAHAEARSWRPEWVVEVEGEVVARSPETVNEALPTGRVEVLVTGARTVATARTPPFPIEEEAGASEELRLRYRFLDLRRPPLQRTLQLRHRLALAARNYLSEQGFVEIETPMLTRSTPEGARDYLVPSRLHPGRFYALPQSPQLFKQLLMVAGFDRYFQLARCFRDEDLRADRQPEFTQIDLEMSFVERDDVLELAEGLVRRLLEVAGLPADVAFERLTFRDALDRFGSDRPDLRYGHELCDVTDLLGGCGFRAFAEVARAGGSIKALRVPGGAGFSRSRFDALAQVAQARGAKGLVWITRTGEGLSSPLRRHLGQTAMEAVADRAGLGEGEALLLVADRWEVAALALGSVRSALAGSEGWTGADLRFAWVTDFPLFELDGEVGRLVARQHPFTAPHPDDLHLLEKDPLAVRALSYDLVLNGVEVAGGSIRNHREEVQRRVFAAMGMTAEEAERGFGFLLEALRYGAPPHGGIAFGYDRLVMLLAGQRSIRSAIAFPKTASAADLLTAAPARVDPEQLAELQLAVLEPAAPGRRQRRDAGGEGAGPASGGGRGEDPGVR